MTVNNAEVARVIFRVADIMRGATERYEVYDDGRAVVRERFVLYALFDLDPATYFAPENRERLVVWEDLWRQTYADGTTDHYRELRRSAAQALENGLPGDVYLGDRYTPEQVRDVARRLVTTKE